ncbi:MAG: hypothetical protein Q8R44_19825 [Novosphingobium sp.]|nr:hypothetical protein [Novosphingobium sp.]
MSKDSYAPSGGTKTGSKGGMGPKVDKTDGHKADFEAMQSFGKGGNANVHGTRLGKRKGTKA